MVLTVTCPTDGEQFAVVEPDSPSEHNLLTASCPSCGHELSIVYPEELKKDTKQRPIYERYREGEILGWELHEDPPDPYTGSDKEIPVEQYVTVKIKGIGGDLYGMYDEEVDQETYTDLVSKNPEDVGSSEIDRFQIWYTPAHDEIAYVIRAGTESGVKTKNVYYYEDTLHIKNRGVPRDSDKQWTYLDRDECYARAVQAGLPGEINKDPDHGSRYNIFLKHDKQPLVDAENELADELVSELARMLIAFQTRRKA